MKIREAKISDIDNLSSLFNSYRMFYGKDSNVGVAKKFLESRIKLCDSKIYVSEVDQCLTGFVQLYPIFSSTSGMKMFSLFVTKGNPPHLLSACESILLTDFMRTEYCSSLSSGIVTGTLAGITFCVTTRLPNSKLSL